MLSFEISIVHRIFGQARSAAGAALYEVVTCAPEPGDIHTDADFTVGVAHGPEALAEAGTVIVPGSEVDFEPRSGPLEPSLTAAPARIQPGTRIASICTGSFVLAAAGLLTGRRATTHWRSSTRFRERFPDVVFDPDVLYTDDDGALTSAGGASAIDLCLHMIRTDCGAAVANDVARGSVVPPHREGDASATQSAPRRDGGSPGSASNEPAPSWNAPTCPSTRSPSPQASAPPAQCGCIHKPNQGYHPAPTAPRSAAATERPTLRHAEAFSAK